MKRLLTPLLNATPGARWRIVAAVLLAAAASGSSVALMGVSAWLLARAAEMPPIMYLNVAVVGVRAFGISRGVFRYCERLVGHHVALRLQGSLRQRTYRQLASTTLVGRRRGDLLSRIVNDVDAVLDVVVRVLLPLASSALVVLGTCTMLGRFSWLNALVLLGTCVVAGAVAPWWAQRVTAASIRRTAEVRGRLADRVHELTRSGIDLWAYDACDERARRIAEADADLREIERRSAWTQGAASALQGVAAAVAVIAALWIGGAAVVSGEVGARMLPVLVLTPLALHEVLADLVKVGQTWTRAAAALTRVGEVLAAPRIGMGDAPETAQLGESEQAGIDVRQATVGWPGGPAVLSEVDVHVGPGERVALVGPSGIGKTTIAATVLGLIPPLGGEVTARGRIGYLAQDAHIFATTLAENVRIGNRNATDDEVADALERAGLRLSPERVVGEMGATLSAGEQRRVALARLLVGHFEAFILDEPTEHLDAQTAARVMEDVWRAVGDAPTLVITHDPGLAAVCDRSVTIRK